MTQKIIAVDIDGVCADLHHAWLGRYNKDYDDTLTAEQITEWDMTKFVKPECHTKIFDYLHDKRLYDDVPALPGALQGVQDLRDMGHRVIFATATNVQMAGRKLHWLETHGFLKLTYGTHSKDFVEAQDKGLVRADCLIDDGLHNLELFQGVKVLMHCQHNASDNNRDAYYRAYGWPDATGYVFNRFPSKRS